jgi:thiosulfate/3-mercaptopyruvate sulfurtransferase
MNTNRMNPRIYDDADKCSGTNRTSTSIAMIRFWSFCKLFTVTVILLLSLPVRAEEERGNLVNVKWLEKNLKNTGVIILDASPSQVYAAKHIPGAISVDIYSWYGLRELPLAEMEKIYQAWGISTGKKIVMYDQGGTILATRLFYSLYYDGFPVKDLLILDGGLFKWLEAGLQVTTEIIPVTKKGSFTISKTNEEVKSELPEFITASGDLVNNVLLDALSPDWHFGEVAPFNRAGHIPNAIMVPSADFFNPDKTFKSTEDIKRMLNYLDIRPEQTIYTHCGGGVAASVPFFAVKFLAGFPKVKLYKESQLGWLSDERELPFWTYDDPLRMRETSWLQFWGGRMIRMYGGTKVSIVDVRSADEFYKGHVPFALNIPADIFRKNIKDPGWLAEVLGESGVNASLEAVVISDGSLNKDAALAFLMIENLGQKKVSVFMDSMDKWIKSGFTLTKDSTVVGNQKVPIPIAIGTLAIPLMLYPGNIRRDVIITELENSHGLYPTIMIASGKDIPAKAQEGKVVHIAYTDLLNGDGTPKAAKDIWKILDNKGIPRYAAIICFSTDPGEAAVNYFILKLMGFPDVKVLVI